MNEEKGQAASGKDLLVLQESKHGNEAFVSAMVLMNLDKNLQVLNNNIVELINELKAGRKGKR